MLTRVASSAGQVVASPYTPIGARQISKDGSTAFASVTFDGLGASVPTSAVKDVISTAQAATTNTVEVQLGGAAIQDAGAGERRASLR